ncbi:MAG: transposase [Nostoc sp.]|uniref:transposase n=1 Tax=Nostoc sp. TaxID=1180 RepID=UPI002FF59D71
MPAIAITWGKYSEDTVGEILLNNFGNVNIEIIGPVRSDPSWQTKAQQGFDSSNFQIDWDNEKVTCPQGHQNTKWLLGLDVSGKPVIRVRFNGVICRNCPVRSSCTKSKTEPRELTLLPQVQHIALQTRRQTQKTPEWKATYNQRAGIESTHSLMFTALGTTSISLHRFKENSLDAGFHCLCA